MKNFLIAFLVFAIWSFFGLWFYSLIKEQDNVDSKTATLTSITDPLTSEISNKKNTKKVLVSDTTTVSNDTTSLISENTTEKLYGLIGKNELNEIVFYFEDGLAIKKNDPLVYVSNKTIDYKYKILNYLLEHPDKEVIIHSFYDASENIMNPNYGIIRGNFIKEELVNIGIDRKLLVVKSDINEINFSSENEFNKGISFEFNFIDYERIELFENTLPSDKIVYPKYSNTRILINQELEDILKEIKEVLERHPETSITVIGHTDNIGNYQDNYALGLKYSRQVRWFFVSKAGINKNRIIAISKGESEPIENNNTQKGRNINRRIEIIYNNI